MKYLLIAISAVLFVSGCADYSSPDEEYLTPTEIVETEVIETPEPVIYFDSCKDAKKAHVAPMKENEPGYRIGLDRDHDGVACDR